MLSRVLIKKQKGRRWLTFIAVAGLLATSVGISGSVLAVHDEDFELDGNIAEDAGGPTFDWSSFFNASGVPSPALPNALRPGFDSSGFDRDFATNANGSFNTSDGSTFSTGSKDTLPITPGWQCGFSSNVNSKTDVTNTYALSYTNAAGDEILYFGLERNANTGTGNVGFWFLQDDVSCETTAGNEPFVGDHVDGDILVVSEFSNGGAVATIQAYKWEGGADGALNPQSVAEGASCSIALDDDSICAEVNTGTLNGIPWLTANKQDGAGHSLRVSEFFEAGLNLTDEGLGGKCFNTFMGTTRSSTSLTATIFDFSLGTLGACTSDVTTQAKDGAGANLTSATIPATGTLEVKDTATIDVDGASTFDADVTFYLCGPGSLVTPISSCATADGVQIGAAKPITANGSVTSDSAFLTSAGSYCWHAVFSGDSDAGVPGDEDNGANECFVVNPRQPTLATQATTGPVAFGSKISDVVTLSNTANKVGTDGIGPGGTINAARGGVATGDITLTAFGPDSCSTVAYGPVTLPANGNNPVGGAGTTFEFTPGAPGQYVFVASYAGDPVNTLGVAAISCANQPSNEKVTVSGIPTNVITKQSWIPNDTATISSSSGNLVGGGSVVFQLWSNATCDGTLLYTETVAVPGGNPTAEVSTSNTGSGVGSFKITTAYADAAASVKGPYSWKVTYTPAVADTGHLPSSSTCDEERFSVTYTNDND